MPVRAAFTPLRSALEQAGVRYAVGGSWASTAFGEPRFTNDVDILADFTPGNRAFKLGLAELERAIMVAESGLSDSPTPFVTPEDILLAKLHWFKTGGEASEVQWRDIEGIVRTRGAALDRPYLERGAAELGILSLLARALG